MTHVHAERVMNQVKIKAHVKSGGLRPSAFGGGSGNDQGGLVANGHTDLGQKGGWRTSNEGQGGRSARSRATRDSKQAAGAMLHCSKYSPCFACSAYAVLFGLKVSYFVFMVRPALYYESTPLVYTW